MNLLKTILLVAFLCLIIFVVISFLVPVEFLSVIVAGLFIVGFAGLSASVFSEKSK